MGKSSLMTRILNYAKKQGCRDVPLYFQEADGEVFTSLEKFLQWFCATITEELLEMHQSPFNVGLPIELPELTQAQVEDLARCASIV